ncbi:hypothetical protein GCM10027423_45600 [Spirosoma arcticum]
MLVSSADYQMFIGDIPVTFDTERHLSAIQQKVVRKWLTELIGTAKVNEVIKWVHDAPVESGEPVYTDVQKQWLDALIPFVCNAVWSEYILRGNVNITDTGPVEKMSATSTQPISDTQRTQLHRFYKGDAESYALQLQALARTDTCGFTGGSRRPSLKTAGGKRAGRTY